MTAPLPPWAVNISLTRGQMAAAWRRATVAVVPSRWADPCPTVVLEAMRAGVPVVGTRVGGIAELVTDTDPATGVLVPPRDPRALRGAVDALLADPDGRARLGATARGRAGAYGVGPVTDRIRAFYAAAGVVEGPTR